MKKKIISLFLALSSALSLLLSGCGKNEVLTLNVHNWGEYISDGSEGTVDTIAEFEKWYKQTYNKEVKVNYSTITSNENMYNRISEGAVNYDVIFPTDYMVERMAKENMLHPLNYENIPNAQYIGEEFKKLYFDPESTYSVPYTYGMSGIIYDANVVDEQDVGSWDVMWNEKYSGRILQYNIPRYALSTAMYKLGLDVNSPLDEDWEKAAQALKEQKGLIKSLVMDEIYNMMESGEASLASYYAGDFITMRADQAENVDLRFYYPERTHFFVDNICIPANAQNKELAEIFINFMLSKEIAVANAQYINYASPNRLVYEDEGYIEGMGKEAMEVLYPPMDNFFELYNKYAYRDLPQQKLDLINTLWEDIKMSLS